MTIFKLPDLGEGLTDAEVVKWHVKVGDVVHVDDPLVSMETAKAIVEVPSPFSGKIVKLFGQEKDVIQTSSPLVEYQIQGAENKIDPQNKERKDNGTVAGVLKEGTTVMTEPSTLVAHDRNGGGAVKATPAVRALAKRLNIDLQQVSPTGPDQSITTKDVENAAKVLEAAPSLEPLRGTRRAMADIMAKSHAEVVNATVCDDARLQNWTKEEDLTVRLIRALVAAVSKEPALNVWFDSKMQGRRFFKEVHVGLAMDTPDGLFVPVIHHAETLNKENCRKKIDELKKQVFDRSIAPEALRGATLTLSNFGKFAGRYSNPIVVPPMVAILGAGKLREEVVAIQGVPKVCAVLPLSLTFDHRAVTGGEATRFLGEVIQDLEK